MLAKKQETESQEQEAPAAEMLSESEILTSLVAGPTDAAAIGETLPELQRARVAQFCYNRVHMRELGLRLASTCSLHTLRAAFGRAGDVVFKQSRDVEETLGALKHSSGHQSPKPISLKGSITGQSGQISKSGS